jgi:hypothetical protein
MTSKVNIETKVIHGLVFMTKHVRYLAFIKKEKTRQNFINELHHMTFTARPFPVRS